MLKYSEKVFFNGTSSVANLYDKIEFAIMVVM
jgi:hypothetical protein